MKLIDISTPKYPNTFCKVDDEDFEFLNQWNWSPKYSGHIGYAKRPTLISDTSNKTWVFMHRVLAKAKEGQEVDHIDHDGLNNCKDNLRVCTRAQNAKNRRISGKGSSKYKGVRLRKADNSFEAEICFRGKPIYLGRFKSEHDAAKAYNAAATKYHGKFANLNVLEAK